MPKYPGITPEYSTCWNRHECCSKFDVWISSLPISSHRFLGGCSVDNRQDSNGNELLLSWPSLGECVVHPFIQACASPRSSEADARASIINSALDRHSTAGRHVALHRWSALHCGFHVVLPSIRKSKLKRSKRPCSFYSNTTATFHCLLIGDLVFKLNPGPASEKRRKLQ